MNTTGKMRDHLYKSKIIKEPKSFLVRSTTTQLKWELLCKTVQSLDKSVL